MATNQAYINETIAQIAAVTVKAVVQAILVERDGEELIRHRSEEAGVRHELDGPSPTLKITRQICSRTHRAGRM